MADFMSSFAQGFGQAFSGDLPEKKKGKDKSGKDKTDANPDTGGAGAASVAADAGAGDAAGADTSAGETLSGADYKRGGSIQFARGGPVLPRSGVQGSKFFKRR